LTLPSTGEIDISNENRTLGSSRKIRTVFPRCGKMDFRSVTEIDVSVNPSTDPYYHEIAFYRCANCGRQLHEGHFTEEDLEETE